MSLQLLEVEPVPCGIKRGLFRPPDDFSIDSVMTVGEVRYLRCPFNGGVVKVTRGELSNGEPRLIFSCEIPDCRLKQYPNPPYPSIEGYSDPG